MSKPKLISETEYIRLLERADELVGCCENSPEEKELEALADELDAYEARRAVVSTTMPIVGTRSLTPDRC